MPLTNRSKCVTTCCCHNGDLEARKSHEFHYFRTVTFRTVTDLFKHRTLLSNFLKSDTCNCLVVVQITLNSRQSRRALNSW